ncbi:MAG: TrbI/VirB10 family protein [Rickettsiaceae bacterium]|nr:MAG: TrbI/VirB10 family protein [Rickettsiaceae bacterium]
MTLQDPNQDPTHNDISPEVHQELSKVAAIPKQNILILVVVCVICGYLFFTFFINNKKTTDNNVQPKAPTEVAKPAQNVTTEIPEIPQLPEPPKLIEPTTQQPINTPPAPIKIDLPPPTIDNNIQQLPLPNTPSNNNLPLGINESDDTRKRKEAKRKSSIFLLGRGQAQKSDNQVEEEADFKKRGNMEMILGRGKVIEGVLETAIDSEFGGEVRALVSRDVFSESGKIVLIPKGSRVFGTYSASNEDHYGRINVDWNRIDLTASGYTINIQSAAIDSLGRKGIQGRVDNKFKERLSNSLLSSAFNIAFANALDKIIAPTTKSQLTVQNQAAAAQLNNIALAIYNDSTKDPATKTQLICSTIQNAIPDKTSAAYTTFASACFSIATSAASATPAQNLTSLMSSVNSAASSLLINTDAQATPTQAQNASKQAFTDVTTTIKDMLQQQQLQPITTIPQGTPIKIYVNKDYKFPKATLNKVSIVQ